MISDEDAAIRSAELGAALAKQLLSQGAKSPAPFSAFSAAASNLLAAGYAMVNRSGDAKLADDWMNIVLATAQAALKENGVHVTFSFVRKS